MKFLAPDYLDGWELQSGVEVVAGAAALESVLAVGSEIVSDFVGAHTEQEVEDFDGAYTRPTTVQLDYAGDTASMDPPGPSPVFSSLMAPTEKHPISDFLSRPQYVDYQVTHDTNTHTYLANPINPCNQSPSAAPTTTYFNYIGHMAQYWRGTLVYDFVILGHALVEVAYKFVMSYPSLRYSANSSNVFSETSVLEGIAKGPTRVRVPMPFFTKVDMMPMTETAPNTTAPLWSPSAVTMSARIVSTMTDVVASVPIVVYLSAMDDFSFYWPCPPGLYGFSFVEKKRKPKSILKKEKKPERFETQIGIDVVPILFETRAKKTSSSAFRFSSSRVSRRLHSSLEQSPALY
jgi:hypothetical protein